MARWPYRVVFWPAGSAAEQKPGTIARASLQAAHTEAAAIAEQGGTAEVRYVAPGGEQRIIATYRPIHARRPHSVNLTGWLKNPTAISVASVVLVSLGAAATLWSRRRSKR